MSGDREEYFQIRPDLCEQAVELIGSGAEHEEHLRRAAYDAGLAEGQAVKLGNGYQTGYDLGHDTGYSARQDSRAYVHGILDGWAAGCEARHQLVEDLLRGMGPNRGRSGQREPELDRDGFEAAS